MPFSSDRVTMLWPTHATGGTPGLSKHVACGTSLEARIGLASGAGAPGLSRSLGGPRSFPTVTWCRLTLLPLKGLSGSKILLFSLKTDKMHERQRRKDYVKRSELFFQ